MTTTEERDVARAAASRRANTYLRLGATLVIAAMLQIYMHPAGAGCGPWSTRFATRSSFGCDVRWRSIRARRTDLASPGGLRLAAHHLDGVRRPVDPAVRVAHPLRAHPGRHVAGGALLNVVVVNAGNRSATLMAATPHALYLLIVPFVAKAANPGANLADVLWFGALLMIVSVTVASRTLIPP
jgi:hypothetical protein